LTQGICIRLTITSRSARFGRESIDLCDSVCHKTWILQFFGLVDFCYYVLLCHVLYMVSFDFSLVIMQNWLIYVLCVMVDCVMLSLCLVYVSDIWNILLLLLI